MESLIAELKQHIVSDLDIEDILVDVDTPVTVYVATESDGVFRATDSGANWTAVNNGVTNLSVCALGRDPTSANSAATKTPFTTTRTAMTTIGTSTSVINGRPRRARN